MPRSDGLNRRDALRLLAAGALLPPALARAEDAPAGHAALSGAADLPGSRGLDGWAPADAPLQGTFTLSNATVLLHDGQRLAGAGIRVEDGTVVEVGAGVRGGSDLDGAWLAPGFTDSGCLVGLVEVDLEKHTRDDDESSDAVTPDARVEDGYNPLSDVIPVTRANGITAVLVHPQPSHLITGQAALFATAGLTVPEAALQVPAGLCINLGRAAISDKGPKSRMGVAMRLREILEGVELPPEEDDAKKGRKKGGGGGKKDKDLKPSELALRRLKQGKLLALVKAERADDILTALELIAQHKLKAALVGCAEGHLVAGAIAAAGVPVLLGPATTQPSSFEHPHARYDNAARLHAAGVRFALRTGAAHFSRLLPSQAAVAVAHGLPFEAAVASLTTAAGEILGVSGHGRLQPGSPATFFQVDGDPLQPRYPVRRVWIRGRQASMESRQTRLYERFRTLR